ncbi:unnamed protein product [Ectocarpus sp. CCAP 1310/34]|nr:unnamed protein product [Ectocarpus sp. CCAP 1310/34]
MAWRRIDVHRAVERGDLAVVKRYLDAGGDPEKKDEKYGAAPVHWAALRGRSDALSLLLERGGDVESRTCTDGTPLVWGCMGGNAPVVRLLLERGANISAKTKGKGTALHHATHSGHPEVVALLLQNGANPKAEDNRGDRPGDKFDPEVTDSDRRAIKQALARVTRGSSSRSGRTSSSRSRRHADTARGGQPSLSASLARGKPRAVSTDNASGGAATAVANGTPQDKGENGHGHHQENGRTPPPRRDSAAKPSTEEEEGAVVVDTTALRTPTKRPRSTDTGTAAAGGGRGWRSSNGGGWGGVVGFLAAAVDCSGGGDSRSRAHPAKDINRDGSNTVRATAAAAATTPAVEGGNDGPRVSPSSPAAFVVSPEKKLPAELDDLRRRVKDLTLSAASAKTGSVEGRAALRRALEEADARARDAVVAERAKSESLGALVQALEQRLRERDEQVQRLTAQVKDRDSRLRQREQEVADLRGRLEERLILDKTLGEPPAQGSAAAALASDRTPPGDDDLAAPHPEGSDDGVSSPRVGLGTRSSPSLSPAPGTVAAAGTGMAASPRLGEGNRRSTMGPGAVLSRDDSFGYALKGLAVGYAVGGAPSGRAEALGWWSRGGWGDGNPGMVKNQSLPLPPAVVVDDHERLGSLYSMIARR